MIGQAVYIISQGITFFKPSVHGLLIFTFCSVFPLGRPHWARMKFEMPQTFNLLRYI